MASDTHAPDGALSAPAAGMSWQRRDAVTVPAHHVWLLSALVVVMAIIGWVVAARLSFVIPAPTPTMQRVWQNLQDPDFLVNARATLGNALFGYALGISIGGVAGVVIGLSRPVRTILQPLVLGGYAVPKIVLYPLVIPILGIGNPSKIFMGAVNSAFPMMVIVAGATLGLPHIYGRLADSLGCSRWQRMTKIVLPAIRRPAVTGMRVGFSLAILGVILAEFFITRRGLGRVIRASYEVGNYTSLFATMVLIFASTFVVSFLLWRLERRLQ